MSLRILMLGPLLALSLPVSAQVARLPDGVKPFTLPTYSCPAADSLLGPVRKSASIKSASGDATFATFRIPSGSGRGLNGRLHLQASLGAMSGPVVPPPAIDLSLELEGAVIHSYRKSPAPHPLELVVDDSIRLAPVPSEVDLSGPVEFSVVTVSGRVSGEDGIRLARGHRLVVRFVGVEDQLDPRFLDQLNTGYRASICGLAAAWPSAGDAARISRVPVEQGSDYSVITVPPGGLPDGAGAVEKEESAPPGVYFPRDVTVVPREQAAYPPEYPPAMLARRVSGSVFLEFIVDSLGRVDSTSIKVLSTTDSGFDASAIHAIALTHFTPGLLGQRPVAVILRTNLAFKIR